jgi:hypothetical protein
MQLRHVAVLAFLLIFSLHGAAQKGCKPKLRENHGNVLTLQHLETTYRKWDDPTSFSRRVIVEYVKNGYDSVSIQKSGRQIACFLAKTRQIVSPRLVMTDEHGTLQAIDSFRPPFRFYLANEYFGEYSGELDVRWEFYPTGKPSKVQYMDVSDRDSLTMEWSETGIIRRKKMVDTEYTYSPEGALMSQRRTGEMPYTLHFYPGGILREAIIDTIILYQQVEWKRSYSPKGILLQERWYKNDEPCSTWREYNSEGVLIKTIKHPPLSDDNPDMYAVKEAPEAGEIYTYVEEDAEFPGGSKAMEAYLLPQFSDLFCQSSVPVSGMYFIRFEINSQGKAVFVSLEGRNGAELEAAVKGLIEQMPGWNPCKRTGRRITQGFVLPVKIHS